MLVLCDVDSNENHIDTSNGLFGAESTLRFTFVTLFKMSHQSVSSLLAKFKGLWLEPFLNYRVVGNGDKSIASSYSVAHSLL